MVPDPIVKFPTVETDAVAEAVEVPAILKSPNMLISDEFMVLLPSPLIIRLRYAAGVPFGLITAWSELPLYSKVLLNNCVLRVPLLLTVPAMRVTELDCGVSILLLLMLKL